MPLLDHYHPPLSNRRPTTGFHAAWAARISASLNRILPRGWFASPLTQWNIEVDVGAFEEPLSATAEQPADFSLISPRLPQLTVTFPLLIDRVGVRIYRECADLELAGVIELISEGNKDRPDSREALLSKCEGFLHEGVGVILVDVVTIRRANLHGELLRRIGVDEELPTDPLYACAYRPKRHGEAAELDIWYEPLRLGEALPSMPLALRGGPAFEVDLEAPYREACLELRIDVGE